jgi:hypothetical protein
MENSIELKTRNMKFTNRFLLSLALGLLLSFTFGTKAKAEVSVYPEDSNRIIISGNVSGTELVQYSGAGKGIILNDNTVLTLDNTTELSFTYIAGPSLNLEIKGEGKLTLSGNNADAILANKLTLSDATIHADMAFQTHEIVINEGVDLTIIPVFDVAIFSHDKTVINGGKIKIKGGYPAILSDGTIEINGGEMDLISTHSSGIEAVGDINITGGTVNASSEKADKYGIETAGTLTVDETKAKVIATAKDKNGVREYPTKNTQNDVEENKTPSDIPQEIKQVTSEPTENINTKQKKTSLSKPKAGNKSITLNWKKVTAKGIKGYEIQYSTDKNFNKDVTKTVTIKKVKTTKTKIKKLKSKTKYYVRIRTYSVKNGEKVYSKWSTKKSVKVK